MTNTSKQVENQHLMGLSGNKEVNNRQKTEREKTVLRNHKENLNCVYSSGLCNYMLILKKLKIYSFLDNLFLRNSIPRLELV